MFFSENFLDVTIDECSAALDNNPKPMKPINELKNYVETPKRCNLKRRSSKRLSEKLKSRNLLVDVEKQSNPDSDWQISSVIFKEEKSIEDCQQGQYVPIIRLKNCFGIPKRVNVKKISNKRLSDSQKLKRNELRLESESDSRSQKALERESESNSRLQKSLERESESSSPSQKALELPEENASKESANDCKPEKIDPIIQFKYDFKIPKRLNVKKKSSEKLLEGHTLKRKKYPSVENQSSLEPELQKKIQPSKEEVAKKTVEDDFDDDCLSIMCESSILSEDFIDKPVAQWPFRASDTKKSAHQTLTTKKKAQKITSPTDEESKLKVIEPLLQSQEWNGCVENEKRDMFDSGYEDCPPSSNISPSPPEKQIARSKIRTVDCRKTDISLQLDCLSKRCDTTPSKSPEKLLSNSVVETTRVNREATSGNTSNSYHTSKSLISILDECDDWRCKTLNLHMIPNNSGNLDVRRAEELKSSFINHLPLFVNSIFGRNFYSCQNRTALCEQLLLTLKTVLNSDECHAVAALLNTACSSTNNYFKVIHNILRSFIKSAKYFKNILEAVRPLLSLSRFKWPFWLQEQVVADLIENNTVVSSQDYTALFRVVSSNLFDRIAHPPNTLNRASRRESLKLQEIKYEPQPLQDIEPQFPESQPLTLYNPPSNLLSTEKTPFPLPISPSLSPPHSDLTSNRVPNDYIFHNMQPENNFQTANLITERILSNEVPRAIDMLKKFDSEAIFKIAHNIFFHHSTEYVDVVHSLMDYFKNRRFMFHLFNKKLDIFMSTLSFNLLIKFIKDESLEKAFCLFSEIKQTGFNYLHAQLFPESLDEIDSQSPVKTALIAVDLCINTHSYDEAVKIFIDNGLLGDIHQWKLKSTSNCDIYMRDRYVKHIFRILLADDSAQMTLLATKLFIEMQKQKSPLSSDIDCLSRLIKKLLERSRNKLAYDVFLNFHSTADTASKCTLAIIEPIIFRAMCVISNSIDPENFPVLLKDCLEWDVYPIWKVRDKTIIVHSDWVRSEIEILFESHVQRLVNYLKVPKFENACILDFSIFVEEFQGEQTISVLKKLDSSRLATTDEVQAILLSLSPPIRSVSDKKKLFVIQEDWRKHLNSRNLSFRLI